MKRVFYKIFFAFLMCSYIPLMAIFVMNYLGVEESNIEKTVEKLCKIIAIKK